MYYFIDTHGGVLRKFIDNSLRKYYVFLTAVSNVSSEGECGRRDLNPSFKLGKLK